MGTRSLAVAAAGIVALASAGCSHGSSGRAAATTTSRPSTSVTTTAPSAGATTETSAVATTTAPSGHGIGPCRAAALTVSLTSLGGAAGTQYLVVVFKNTTTPACTLEGYPGLSFVDARGAQIGAAVPRVDGATTPVTLAPGGTAGAQLAYHDAFVSTFATCRQTAAAGIRVYPPNETASVVVPTSLMACANAAANGVAGISAVTTVANLPQ